nr:MAG: capsid protein [Chemarfal virus 68]
MAQRGRPAGAANKKVRPYKANMRSNTIYKRKVYGKGDYSSTKAAYNRNRQNPNYVPSTGRTLLTSGGELLGSAFGLGELGKTAGKHLSHLFGLGDYSVKSNVFLQGSLPQIYNMPAGGGTIIRFQEYLGDVITSGTANTFSNTSYSINAANDNTFPWLSQIAANYEQYSFEGLIFEYRSTSANALNSTNTALGSVMMATQYDVSDTVFASKAEMLNYEFSNSIKPSENCLHMIECAPRQSTLTELYTLVGNPPAGFDPRFYNLGRFQIATTGFQGTNVNIGELHVTYQVRLLKPKLFDTIGNDIGYCCYNASSAGVGQAFGLTRSLIIDTLGLTFPDSNSFIIPDSGTPRQFQVDLFSSAVATSLAMTVTIGTLVNCTLQGTIQQSPVAATASTYQAWFCRIITNGNGPATFSVTVTGGFNGNMQVRLLQIPLEATQ